MPEKNTARPRGTDSAKVIQVIQTSAPVGSGTESDPNRIVTQYWSLDGKLLAQADPEIMDLQPDCRARKGIEVKFGGSLRTLAERLQKEIDNEIKRSCVTDLEQELSSALGEDGLKNIGERLAEIVRQHGLQKSPDVYRKLFRYMADVIERWNCV